MKATSAAYLLGQCICHSSLCVRGVMGPITVLVKLTKYPEAVNAHLQLLVPGVERYIDRANQNIRTAS